MTASSAVVLGNLAYLIGAVVLATLGGLIVWLRHRKPRSVTANVESFHRGLQALAPVTNGANHGIRPVASGGVRIQREPDPAPTTDPTTVSAAVDLAGGLPIPTNGNGRGDGSDRKPEAAGLAAQPLDGNPTPPDGVVAVPAVSPPSKNGAAGCPPLSLPVPPLSVPAPPVSVPAPPVSLPAPPVSVSAPPVSLSAPPVSLSWANATTAPPPAGPDLPEITIPPLIDEPASERPVAGRAGVEAG